MVNSTVPLAEIQTSSPAETKRVALALADVVIEGDVLVLTGDLGAGKTCFTQGLAVGLGIDGPVTSPTFTLANRYRGRMVLHHLDVYRLDGLSDIEHLGLSELLDDGVTVIEWGDKIRPALPDGCLEIAFRYPDAGADEELAPSASGADFDAPTERLIEFQAHRASSWPRRLAGRWLADKVDGS